MASTSAGVVPGTLPVCEASAAHHRRACAGGSFFKEYAGKRYCVLHYPICSGAEDKTAAFNNELRRKVRAGDYDFCGAQIPEFRWEEFAWPNTKIDGGVS